MVLEVGCDNGILICMFATLFPDTRFTGIDPCEPAIKIALERAKYLGLTNIEFKVATLDTLVEESNKTTFDLILSVTVFHEILADGLFDSSKTIMSDSNLTFSIEEADNEFMPNCVEISDLKVLAQILSADGKFISVDRW